MDVSCKMNLQQANASTLLSYMHTIEIARSLSSGIKPSNRPSRSLLMPLNYLY